MGTARRRTFAEAYARSGLVTSTADAADAFCVQEVITATELRRATHPRAPDRVLPQPLTCSLAKPDHPAFGYEGRAIGHVYHVVGTDSHTTGKRKRTAGQGHVSTGLLNGP